MLALRSLLFHAAFWLWSTTLALGSLLPMALGWQAPVLWISRIWPRGVTLLLRHIAGITHRIEGREHLPPGPCILAAKHQSAWDTIIVLALFDTPAIVMKKELLRVPIYGRLSQALKMIVVDREGGAKALRTMLTAAKEAVTAGRNIVIFPQGTRLLPGEKAPYLPGIVAIYREAGLPVVPAAVNSGFFWPKYGWRRPPGTIRLRMLEPIPPGLKRDDFLKLLEARIEPANAALEAETRAEMGLG